MVFTVAWDNAFFDDADQLAIPVATCTQMQTEGTTTVGDLLNFNYTNLEQLMTNLKKPDGTIWDPNPNAAARAENLTPVLVLCAESQMRLTTALHAAKYYEAVGREFSARNMRWNPCPKHY
eukprot:14496283-Ditylum_brightwellii.AAC.1